MSNGSGTHDDRPSGVDGAAPTEDAAHAEPCGRTGRSARAERSAGEEAADVTDAGPSGPSESSRSAEPSRFSESSRSAEPSRFSGSSGAAERWGTAESSRSAASSSAAEPSRAVESAPSGAPFEPAADPAGDPAAGLPTDPASEPSELYEAAGTTTGATDQASAGGTTTGATDPAPADRTDPADATDPAGPTAGEPSPPGDAAVPLRAPAGPDGQDGQDPTSPHARNGTVQHGPAAPGAPADRATEDLDPEERALRALLHQAVREVQPSDGALDHLRRAVPARRARKRQALVGVAAAALFVGTAVPAVVHVSGSSGSGAHPSAVGHASQAQGGTSQGRGPDSDASTAGGSADEVRGTGGGGMPGEDEGAGDSTGAGAAEGAGPSSSADAGAPACSADQLGPAVASTAAPDSSGAVYGSFRVTNVSGDTCTVGAPGTIGVTTKGAADPAKVSTMRHAAGDAAAGLPDPSLEAASGLVLKPGTAYEVKFAWVPSETCPTTGTGTGGGTGEPAPDPTPTGGTSTTGAATGDDGTAPQTLRADGTVEGSVTVTYTAATGTGEAGATVVNACAGTVYWTGVLTVS